MISHYRVIHVEDRMTLRRIIRCFRQMRAISHSKLPMRAELQFTLLDQLLVWCANYYREQLRRIDPRINRTIEYMATHFADPISIQELCEVAGVSRSLLPQLFQRITGQSPMRYLEHLRIDRAMQLLRLSTQSLEELASAVGFCDSKHFSRRFKQIVGVPPGRYRQSQGK